MFGFSCKGCKAQIKRPDWCACRDLAWEHLERCKPDEIRIYTQLKNGTWSGGLSFKNQYIQKTREVKK